MRTAAQPAFAVLPTDLPVGAEIRGLDLSQDLDEPTFAALRDATDRHGVVFLRDQDLAPERQVALTRRLGTTIRHVRQEYALPGFPEVHLISNIKQNERSIGSAYAGDDWHTDLCFMAYPCRYAMLHAREVPERDGRVFGDTLFINTAHAYETLPADLRQWVESRRAVFQYHRAQVRKQAERAKDHPRADLTEAQKKATPDVTHAAVLVHPVTGAKCLYVNKVYTFGFEGMSEDEAAPWLERLYQHLYRPEVTYAHRWQRGDVILWDNYSTQHKAIGDYTLPLRRLMHRTATEGTHTF